MNLNLYNNFRAMYYNTLANFYLCFNTFVPYYDDVIISLSITSFKNIVNNNLNLKSIKKNRMMQLLYSLNDNDKLVIEDGYIIIYYDEDAKICATDTCNYEEHVANAEEDTEEPVEDTEEPVEDTREPLEDTDEPVEDTDEPVEDTREPVEDTENPLEDTENPLEDTEEPLEDTRDPVEDTKNSLEDTENPLDDAEEPINPDDTNDDEQYTKYMRCYNSSDKKNN